MFEFGIVVAALGVRLDSHFQNHALPIRVALLALDQYCRRQHPLDRHVPLPECDVVILGHHKSGDLIARTQTGQGVGDRRRGRIFPAQDRVGVGRNLVRLVLHRDCLDRASPLTVDLDGDGLKPSGGTGELTETKAQLGGTAGREVDAVPRQWTQSSSKHV